MGFYSLFSDNKKNSNRKKLSAVAENNTMRAVTVNNELKLSIQLSKATVNLQNNFSFI